MRIHYVEDNAKDARIISDMVRSDVDVELCVSERLEDFVSSQSRDNTDFIMLDVRRPDAVSIQDDIRKIRAFTDAPIVLVTSDGSEIVRREAFAGGADAVLDKGELNHNLLRQIALNSTLRHKVKTENSLPVIAEPRATSASMKASLESLSGTFSYIEFSLQTLHETVSDAGRSATADYVGHLLETVKAIRAYAQDDLSQATRTPVHELLLETAQRVSRNARAEGVDLVMETETSWFTQIGSGPLAALGMHHLIGGLLRACSRGDRVSVRCERDENGIALNLFLSRVLFETSDELFDLAKSKPSIGFDAKASIQLGLTLLSVPKEQVDVHVHRNSLFIKVRI